MISVINPAIMRVVAFASVQGSPETTVENSASTSHTINLPAGVAAGEKVVIFSAVRNGRVLTTPSGCTQLFKAGEGGGSVTHACYHFTAAGGETTVTLPVAVGASGVHIAFRTSGWSAIEGSINAGGVDPPSVTPSGGSTKYLWFASGANIDGGSTLGTAPTGFSNTVQGADSSNTTLAVARRELEAASLDPAAWGTAGAASYAGTVAVHPT